MRARFSGPAGVFRFALALGLSLATASAAPPARAGAVSWVRADETVVPIRADISRNGAIKGFLRKGQVVRKEAATEHWVKVKANDSIEGWVPASSVADSGPPVRLDPGAVKRVFLGILALGLGAFLALGIRVQRRRKAEGEARARQALLDAKRRLQNKVQLLFADEPRIRSHLAMTETPLREFLQGTGYIANLEAGLERFLDSSKAFKPNLIIADYAFRPDLEKLISTDAILINTPIIYLRSDAVARTPEKRVRAYLEAATSEKELTETLAACLKRSPEKIQYSVKPVALKGSIQAGTLMDLLHFLAAVKKTGQLMAVSGKDKGEILLHKGDIARAIMKGMTGAPAAAEILGLAAGDFEFHERKTVGPPAAHGMLNTHKLLMDWAKAKDESDHHTRP